MKQFNNPLTTLKDLETYFLTNVSSEDSSSMQMKIFIVMLISMLIKLEERVVVLESIITHEGRIRGVK
jgi:hypothetical protein